MASSTTQPIDWNAIGTLVNAYHDATGQWLGYDQIVALNWTAASATNSGSVASSAATATTIGTGADSFVIKLSEDAYNGDAQYTVSVDGNQVGGTLTASALHSSGQSDTLTLLGDWGTGAHTVSISFLNDSYGGSATADRNLYVDAISYDGAAQAGGTFDLLSNGSHDVAIASTSPISSGVTTSGESILPSGFTLAWQETFDSGVGQFSNDYGHVWAHDGQVDISSWASDGFGASGAMIAPSTASAGDGYGLFSWTVQGNQANAPGAFMCLWPASNVWPGPELDMAEVSTDGSVYSTIHWKGDDGSNQFQSFVLDGINFTDKHTYAMDWEAGRLTGYVDGVQKWTTTEHVPLDFAHGGENEVSGVGEQAAWAAASQHGDNLVTLYEATYSTHSVIA